MTYKVKISVGVLLLSFSHFASAINGYFAIAYGAKMTGMAGAAIAFPEDTLTGAVNPAGMSQVEGLDIGARFLYLPIPENFNQPYRSRTIQEFWRRWHMTLSRWFRDYVYIPLGGNRLGVARTYINLLGVFILTGFWHGASWNFLIWGLIHGLFLIIERLGLANWLQRVWAPIGHLYVIGVVLLGWVFFRTDNITSALEYLGAMVAMNPISIMSGLGDIASLYMLSIAILGSILATLPERDSWESKDTKNLWKSILLYSFLSITTLLSLALISSYSHKAFIYFRF